MNLHNCQQAYLVGLYAATTEKSPSIIKFKLDKEELFLEIPGWQKKECWQSREGNYTYKFSFDGRYWWCESMLQGLPFELNQQACYHALLQPNDCVCIQGVSFDFVMKNSSKGKLYESIFNELESDALTGMKNRKSLDICLTTSASEYLHNSKDFSVVMVDIDDFRKINNEKGHLVGDVVLKEFASLLHHLLPDAKLIARYGGEEFCVVFEKKEARFLEKQLNSILKTLQTYRFKVQHEFISITFSAGFALASETINNKAKDIDVERAKSQILMRADENLLLAKQKGKNQVLGRILNAINSFPHSIATTCKREKSLYGDVSL